MLPIEQLKRQLNSKGFIDLANYSLPRNLLWKPDLIFKKNKHIYLILLRTNNHIPDFYLTRLTKVPKPNLIPLVIFPAKISSTRKKELISLGISVGFFIEQKLENLVLAKQKVGTSSGKKNKNIPAIRVFVSSRQIIKERKFVKDRIVFLRNTLYPLYEEMIEYNRFKLNNLNEYIRERMSRCEWIIVLLEDEYSSVVKYEVTLALKILRHENIFVFVKSTYACRQAWDKVLKEIENLPQKDVKYLPYDTQSDLETTLIRAILTRLKEISKKRKTEISAPLI